MVNYRSLNDEMPDEIYDAHPASSWLLWPSPRKGPWLLRIMWTRVDGRLECCGFEVRSCRLGDEEWPGSLPRWDESPAVLTTTTLRKLPLGQILDDLREEGWQQTRLFAEAIEDPDDPESVEVAANMRAQGRRDRPRRRGVPPLTEVAQVYLAAQRRREPPTEAVRAQWGAAHSTAAKWVMRARAEGYLPPVKGKK